ncbi:hypothetical protein MLD38_018116 [Melastoma candidum]|uniref:Uncharacterized protein n=1 Tax=Melastoma candidum TaxID=119954 RepID=A0ACB9QS96_9MYRT|nr:hypothetical protein MLD38_018116 [Melastoma candidum]
MYVAPHLPDFYLLKRTMSRVRYKFPRAEPCLVEQRTNNCAHVACRLCGQVFANSVALVNHIDMHVSRDMELARRAGNFGLFQFPCILPLNPAQPTNKLMLGGPPFAQGREHAAPPLNQTRAAIPPRNLSFGSPQLARSRLHIQITTGGFLSNCGQADIRRGCGWGPD